MPKATPGRQTEATQLTELLREEIVSGAVQPGQKLKLVPLAKRFDVSRGPLREAASRLAAEGLVRIEDQRGFRVTPVSREDLLDVTQTRKRIETLALRDAIAHGDLTWEGQVMATCHVLDRVTPHDDSSGALTAFSAAHQAFHDALVSACPSAYLLGYRDNLYALTERYRTLAAEAYIRRRDSRDITGEHQAIATAAVERDADTACALLEEHLDATLATLLDAYPETFGEPP